MNTALALPAAKHLAIAEALRTLLAYLLMKREVARQRKALADLDAHLLRDIGISRTEAARETSRSFWSF